MFQKRLLIEFEYKFESLNMPSDIAIKLLLMKTNWKFCTKLIRMAKTKKLEVALFMKL